MYTSAQLSCVCCDHYYSNSIDDCTTVQLSESSQSKTTLKSEEPMLSIPSTGLTRQQLNSDLPVMLQQTDLDQQVGMTIR